MTENNSDYTAARTNLLNLLPEILKSDTNRALFENLFNRFLTKADTKRIAGYVGSSAVGTIGTRQIKENQDSPKAYANRQAFQLQPLMYSKIGTVEHIQSWVDCLNKLESMGIDTSKYADWGRMLSFNWIPPIDLDKLVNYQNYYWYDQNDANASPQYITIKNRASIAFAKMRFIQRLIAQYGSDFPIIAAPTTTKLAVQFNMVELFKPGVEMHIKWTALSQTASSFSPIAIAVVGSEYDIDTNTTVVEISSPVDPLITGSAFTLEQVLAAATADYSCLISGESGWDAGGWDEGGWSETCQGVETSPEVEQWSTTNLWVHKSDLENISAAKQAKLPIIEFDYTLELNAWNFSRANWKFRPENSGPFEATYNKPYILELKPFPVNLVNDYDSPTSSVRFGWEFGDLTELLAPGYQLAAFDGSSFLGYVTVIRSFYAQAATPEIYQTYIQLSPADISLLTTADALTPSMTSVGTPWRGYDIHWVFAGLSDATPSPRPFEVPVIRDFGADSLEANYTTAISKFAQKYVVTFSTDTFTLDPTLRTLALMGTDDIRVYRNGVRVYGEYVERTEVDLSIGPDTDYVSGVKLDFNAIANDEIIIEVGPAGVKDLGLSAISVRMTENDDEFILKKSLGQEPVLSSIIEWRRSEQVKSAINQYPLFDLYDIFGQPAMMATNIFGYKENADMPVVSDVGLRLERNTSTKNYMFEQLLLGDAEETLAFKDLSAAHQDHWFNTQDRIVYSWHNDAWSDLAQQGLVLAKVSKDVVAPLDPWNGMLWYDIATDTLYVYDGSTFVVHLDQIAAPSDPTLRTIWRHGNNLEEYVPKYLNALKEEVPIGSESGQWEIPDPLYYNAMHENRRNVSLTQVTDHFNSVMAAQSVDPNFNGAPADYYHVLYPEEINLGLGGKIKEYQAGFDTLLSTLFVDGLDVLQLVSFMFSQQTEAVNKIKEILIDTIAAGVTSFDSTSGNTLTSTIASAVIQQFETNAYQAHVFGDSTSFDNVTNTGVQHWPTTPAFLGFIPKKTPFASIDKARAINHVMSHSGFYVDCSLDASIIAQISKTIISLPDPGYSPETIGRQSTFAPPVSLVQFNSSFSPDLRPGVFWYMSNSSARRLYRLNVGIVGDIFPPATLPDGTLWFDTSTGQETLRVKSGTIWILPNASFVPGLGLFQDGATPETSQFTAWDEIDLNAISSATILEIERSLFQAAPEVSDFNLDAILSMPEYPASEQDRFNALAHEVGLTAPLANPDYSASLPFTWNYKYSNPIIQPGVDPFISGGCWMDLYEKNFGTAYPHLEPWVLQGYVDKPVWWDAEYANDDQLTYGPRRWKQSGRTVNTPGVGMWTNILIGVVPVGQVLPSNNTVSTGAPGEAKSWNYVPVNTTDLMTDGYMPDDLLAPYTPNFTPGIYAVDRSIFITYAEIVKANLEFSYGDQGFEEWKWKHSARFIYDQVQIAFKLDPIFTLYSLFGFDRVAIDLLDFDTRTQRTPAHGRTIFHGEMLAGDGQYLVNGLNQWMIDYNRFLGYDAGFSDFMKKWTGWQVPLSYQFDTFLDKTTFSITKEHFDITDVDYLVTIKRSPGVELHQTDALHVAVTSIPPNTVRFNDQFGWRFEVDTYIPNATPVEYYEPLRYPVYINPVTNTLMLYTYQIVEADAIAGTISVAGDKRDVFTPGRDVTILQSSLNDGANVVESSALDPQGDKTVIKMVSPVVSDIHDGIIRASVRGMTIRPMGAPTFAEYGSPTTIYYPFELGSELYVASTGMLPKAVSDTTIPYFLIPKDGSNTEFYLADTYNEALTFTPIQFTSTGSGDHFIGKVFRTFYMSNGVNVPTPFYEYEADKNSIRSITPPISVSGLQSMLDLIFGYSKRQRDIGFIVNYDKELVDPDTGWPVEWELEVDRFLNWTHALRNYRLSAATRYETTLDPYTNVWRFVGTQPPFATGTRVNIITGAVTPQPFVKGNPYYIIRDTDQTFRLAATYENAVAGNPIVAIPTLGVGTLYIAATGVQSELYARFEINAMRNGIWFRPDRGVVSDMNQGPFEAKRPLLFDQYGRPLDKKYISVYREDTITQVAVSDGILNDVDPNELTFPSRYGFIHLAGARFYIDTYEHVLLFNYYTASGDMIYDPFLGLNVDKFELDFYRQPKSTGRPNVGGHYLRTDGNLYPNIEKAVDDMRQYYDTFIQTETNERTRHSRALLGYDGKKGYLNHISVGDKSQFLFYRGMINYTGTNSAVKAFVNSKKFIDAGVDEYWAFKVGEFGSSYDKEYPEMFLFPEDARGNEARFQFVDDASLLSPGFTQISLADTSRWNKQPEAAKVLYDDGSAMYFELKPTATATVTFTPTGLETVGCSINGSYIRHNFGGDHTKMMASVEATGTSFTTVTPMFSTSVIPTMPDYIPNVGMIQVFRNGVKLVSGTDFIELETVGVLMSNAIELVQPMINDRIDVVFGTGTLVAGKHYDVVNSRIVRFNFTGLPSGTVLTIVKYLMNAEAQTPGRLIDRESDTTIEVIRFWDPARGHIDFNAERAIDSRSATDPALYTDSTVRPIPAGSRDGYAFADSFWNKPEVGTVWVDTSEMAFLPYYDQQVFDDLSSSKLWGHQADWSVSPVYEWVESTMSPTEWDEASLAQAGQTFQPEDQTSVTGTAKKVLLKTDFSDGWVEYRSQYDHRDPAMEGTLVNGDYTLTLSNIKPRDFVIRSFDVDAGTITAEGDYASDVLSDGMSIQILTGLNAGTYVVTGSSYDVQTGYTEFATEATIPHPVEDFADPLVLGEVRFYPLVNTFVNGLLKEKGVQPSYTGALVVSGVKISDTVTVGWFVTADPTVIQAGVDDAVFSFEVQYSKTLEMTDSQYGVVKYYFWVKDRLNRSKGKNLSAYEIGNELRNMSASYMFFRHVIDGADAITSSITPIKRIGKVDAFTAIVPTTTFTLSHTPYAIKAVFNVQLGRALDETEYSLAGQDVTLVTPALFGDKINIEYEYLGYSTDKPVRFDKMVLRGIRGRIDKQRRYVVQFVRDFTLRDRTNGKTELDLKDLHEEWTMIREKQLSNVDRGLWDRITEAMIGYKLDNASVRVPSLDREIYDLTYNTDERFGLGSDQAFVSADLALSSIMGYLNSPTVDFGSINVGQFLASYNNMTSATDKIGAMNGIYNTFGSEHVNAIFFTVLNDAFSVKLKYADVFKTSWVALTGVRVFETTGAVDD